MRTRRIRWKNGYDRVFAEGRTWSALARNMTSKSLTASLSKSFSQTLEEWLEPMTQCPNFDSKISSFLATNLQISQRLKIVLFISLLLHCTSESLLRVMQDIQFKEEDFKYTSNLSTDSILSTFLIKHTLYIYYEC